MPELRIAEYLNGVLAYRDATQQEMADLKQAQENMPELEPSADERLKSVEATLDDVILMMADLIGGETK